MKPILHFRGAVFITLFIAAAGRLGAQVTLTNPPAPPPPMNYQLVNPGVTLRQLSPVVYFRGILGMSSAERERALAGKSDDYRNAVLEKVREYQALPADIREARLRQTQLRWDLICLMKLPPAARPAPPRDSTPEDRALLEDRLRQWDQTPANLQKAFLAKESFLDFYLRWQASSPSEQKDILNSLPPARRQEWTQELARWQTLPEAQRQQLCGQFRQFFDLNAEQQNKALTTFTDAERKDMERVLRKFANLLPPERKACINSFQKFASMAPDERNQFLKNAARWESMTASERNLWRELVQRFPVMPPMPPGFKTSGSPPYPPLPPGMTIEPPMSPGMKEAAGAGVSVNQSAGPAARLAAATNAPR